MRGPVIHAQRARPSAYIDAERFPRIVVIDIAEQQARFAAMNDQTNVAADPHRPEILVLAAIQLVEAQAGAGGIQLQVEGRRLDELLFVVGQAGETIGKGVGDAEFHGQQ